jgi:heptosyltransferase-2
MGWKGNILEAGVWIAGKLIRSTNSLPENPDRIFVFRNNDIGDLLATSPLLQALKLRFPKTKLVVAVGPWNKDTLLYNPYVDEVIQVNAPWCNRTIYGLSLWTIATNSAWYILNSQEIKMLKERQFDIGIDVYGSQFGSLLMLRLGVPFRLGVKGYFAGGGYSACQLSVPFDIGEHVSRQNLRFAELCGSTWLPEPRPQIYLSDDEAAFGQSVWLPRDKADHIIRVLIAPGAGIPSKSWGGGNYTALAKVLTERYRVEIKVVGASHEADIGEQITQNGIIGENLSGRLKLRETFSVVAASDIVFCNGSMIMHVAAAFKKPEVVLLGEKLGSAQKHQKLWGYADTCVSLGIDPGHPNLATLKEAIDSADHLLHNISGRSFYRK